MYRKTARVLLRCPWCFQRMFGSLQKGWKLWLRWKVSERHPMWEAQGSHKLLQKGRRYQKFPAIKNIVTIQNIYSHWSHYITSLQIHFLFFDTVKIFASRIHVWMEDHAMERTDHVIVRLIVRGLNANFALEVIFNPFLQRIIYWCYIQSLPC